MPVFHGYLGAIRALLSLDASGALGYALHAAHSAQHATRGK